MLRTGLRTSLVLGALITLLGGTGIFAVISDRATTGTNSAESGELGRAADIRVAEATLGVTGVPTCGTFSDDLASGFFSLLDVQPSATDAATAYFCLSNDGDSNLNLSASAIDVIDIDVDCTGDEEAAGDTTCGADQAGELSGVLVATFGELDCSDGSLDAQTLTHTLADLTTPTLLPVGGTSGRPEGDLASGQTACYAVQVQYPDFTPAEDAQRAQSDGVTWRFAFDGVAAN